MIRTANLTDSISRKAGGLHESVRRLVQSLTVAGVGVRVLSVEDEFTEKDLAAWEPVPIDIFPRTWPYSFGYAPEFLKVLSEYQPDLTHTHGMWLYPSIATATYCVRRRLPYMISPHGMVDPWAVRHQRWKKVIAYAIYETNHLRGARCIRALCESEARSIRRMGLTNPVAVVPNGIDIPRDPEAGTQLPPWLGFITAGRKVLLFLSRIHRKKGLANLLRAWSRVRSESLVDEWVLAIAGWDQGGFEDELKRLACDLGLSFAAVGQERPESEDQKSEAQARKLREEGPLAIDLAATPASVVFLGPLFGKDKAASYRSADAFILPSFSEGLPMVVLEAWAYGKPVLMTPECNLPEGFTAAAAIKIEPTAEGIAEGLRTLFGMSRSALWEMGASGRKLVEERFTWSRVAIQVKVTYEWMLGGGPAPGWMF